MTTGLVSVVLVCGERPLGLPRALRSVLSQRGFGRALEIVGLDVSDDGSGLGAVRALAHGVAAFRAASAPRARGPLLFEGVLRAARGAEIALLRADEEAPRDWLAKLLAAHWRENAEITAGPIAPQLPIGLKRGRAFFERRLGSAPIKGRNGALRPEQASNLVVTRSCAARAALAPPGPPRADADAALLHFLDLAGGRFAWSPEAVVRKYPSNAELDETLVWRLSRARRAARGEATKAGALAALTAWGALASLSCATGLGRRETLARLAAARGALDAAAAPRLQVLRALPAPANDVAPRGGRIGEQRTVR